MKRHLLSVICMTLLLPVLTAEEKTGEVLSLKYDFKEAKKEMEYALYLPKGYNKEKKYPMILALHGLGHTPTGILKYPGFTKLAEKHGYILAAPMGYNRRGWYGSLNMGRFAKPKNLAELSEKDVMNVLALVRKKYNIDNDRIYLMGHSMGGGGTWHIAMKTPKIWAALAPIAPAIFKKPDGLTKIKHIPVIVVQGDKDRMVPVRLARTWVAKMKELKMKHSYIEVKDGDHVKPAIQKLPEIFAFFEKHRRKSQ